MKKAVLIIGVIIVLLAALMAVIAIQPEDYSVTRSTQVAASPQDVHPHINDFRKWEAWSPWAKLDPEMNTTITGPASGVGAHYEWQGNNDVGKGNMTIIESRPGENVKIDLQFTEPFTAASITEFNLQPADDGTNVTWTTSGKNGFLAKAMCLVIDMDTMMGPDFERGLNQLKSTVESGQ